MRITNIVKAKYYITTPIFYVNSVPHIGHLYTALLADAHARWRHLNDRDQVVFGTGTDEHGFKIQKRAQVENMECLKFCDNISGKFRALFDLCDVKYTDFIRTTENRHKQAVEHFWKTLYEKGFIYKSTYEGWYSVNDECFLSDDQVQEVIDKSGKAVKVSSESGHLVERTSETNYMFRLSEFKQKLRGYLNGKVVVPQKYQDLLYSQIDALDDLSVSRERKRVHWGIPVPNDSTQIIYVWLDALVNYLTMAGYPNDMKKFNELWPANTHVIGKDIIRFHAIYWPAFLMAAELKLPKRIVCHGHWLVENKKMSKSVGNVIDPLDCLKSYSKDGLRYFLLREGVPESDCNILKEKFAEHINVELANTLGNLFQRCFPFNKQLVYPNYEEIRDDLNNEDKRFLEKLAQVKAECNKHYEVFNFYNGIQTVMSVLRSANLLVQEYKPWALIKSTDPQEQRAVKKMLFMVYESLRISGILLQPIVPELSGNLLDRLNIEKEHRYFEFATVNSSQRPFSTRINQQQGVLFARLKV